MEATRHHLYEVLMGDDAVTAILERLHHACGDYAFGFRAQLVDVYSPMAVQ